ncbi:MAG: Sulfite exporter TauE/SafE [Actinomycetia bacterium]|nr:Sulfite exporter TauE/SafE [Actinomycetes bacterium]
MDASALFLTGAGTGLLAGGTSCAAVQVGLLAGAVRDVPRPAAQIGVFLGAKLATHAALGAALGLVGAAVQPGPRVRAALLAGAAVVLALFALDLLGFRPARRLLRRSGEHCPAPAPGSRLPAVLGASTVLVPCGLTLSAELLAVTSRSALAGAAVMTGFVLGTAPLFGLIGITLGRGLALLRGRLTALVGIGLLVLAGWTLQSGLRLGGWLPTPATTAPMNARFVQTDPAGVQTITVWALDRGYRPAILSARAGVHTVLVVRTRQTTGCARDFVIPGRGVERVLPVDGETSIDLGAPRTGRLRFTCAVGHYPGAITFR